MRAILVSVDYADLLAVTLPWNRHHFEEVWVVTSHDDVETMMVARENDARVYCTDSFYTDGAVFNKWKALEEGLFKMGRHGWLCIMDADVLWPRKIPTKPDYGFDIGRLYSPRRRMLTDLSQPISFMESEWWKLPLHPQEREWAGYTQIFHADDQVLGPPPWHQIDWKHAGGADSFFQAKWADDRKIRPNWEVLHLGEAGVNWCGRSTPLLDGTIPTEAESRRKQVRDFRVGRISGPHRFDAEKLS